VRELSNLHTKRLMVNFETDESVQEREIDILTQHITEIFRHAESLLKKFGNQGDESNISQQELTVRANMQRSIAKKLQGLSTSFRTSQKVISRAISQNDFIFPHILNHLHFHRNIFNGFKLRRTEVGRQPLDS
jgi:hypothetical protein